MRIDVGDDLIVEVLQQRRGDRERAHDGEHPHPLFYCTTTERRPALLKGVRLRVDTELAEALPVAAEQLLAVRAENFRLYIGDENLAQVSGGLPGADLRVVEEERAALSDVL